MVNCFRMSLTQPINLSNSLAISDGNAYFIEGNPFFYSYKSILDIMF
jgi:hypothetical protein